MNDLLHVGSALFNHIKNNGTIDCYYHKAKQSASVPYCLVYFMSANDDYTFNDKSLNADYVVKVISDKNFPEEAIRLYGDIHEIVQDSSLSMPGYNVIRLRRESILEYEDQFHFWNIGGLYNLDITQQ